MIAPWWKTAVKLYQLDQNKGLLKLNVEDILGSFIALKYVCVFFKFN